MQFEVKYWISQINKDCSLKVLSSSTNPEIVFVPLEIFQLLSGALFTLVGVEIFLVSTKTFSGFVLQLKTFNDFMNNPDESVSRVLLSLCKSKPQISLLPGSQQNDNL